MTIGIPMPFSEDDLKAAQAESPLIESPEGFKPVEKNVQGKLRRLVMKPPADIQASDWIETDLVTERDLPPELLKKQHASPEKIAANREAHAKYCHQIPVGLVETPKPFTLGEAVAEMTALQLKAIMEGGLHPKPIVCSGSNCSHGDLAKKFQDTINKNIVDPVQLDVKHPDKVHPIVFDSFGLLANDPFFPRIHSPVGYKPSPEVFPEGYKTLTQQDQEQSDLQKQFRREIREDFQLRPESDYFGPFALKPADIDGLLEESMQNPIPLNSELLTNAEAVFDIAAAAAIPGSSIDIETHVGLDPQTLKRENASVSGAMVNKDSPLYNMRDTLTAKQRREKVRVTEEDQSRTTQYSRQRDASIQTLRTKLRLLLEKAREHGLEFKDEALGADKSVSPDEYEKAGNQLISSLMQRSSDQLQGELTWHYTNMTTQHQDLMDHILSFSRVLNFRDDQLTKEIRRRKTETAK